MRRTERLFQIIQVLRRSRAPVTGTALAQELEISLRTLYRDMAELIAQRVPIRGEAGTGYVLEEGYDLPPLMLTADELQAAALGAQWVAARGDDALARGAKDLIAKLAQVAPNPLQAVVLDSGLAPVSFRERKKDSCDVSLIRGAIRNRYKVEIEYQDAESKASTRIIWPFLLAYTEEVRIICGWCELRGDFRHFRTDRVRQIRVIQTKYPRSIAKLHSDWKHWMEQNRQR